MTDTAIWCILLIDDDEDDYLLVNKMLSEAHGRKCQLEWASSYEKGRRSLKEKLFDAVLIDYDLGIHNGLDLIREAVVDDYPSPFILLTGRGTYDIDIEAMHAGVTIYLTKAEVNPLLLERAIRYAIELKQNQRIITDANARLLRTQLDLQQQNQQLQNEIIERKRVEANLRGILDATKESIWLFDPEGIILLANDTALNRMKVPAGEIIGKNYKVFMTPEIAAARHIHLRKVIDTGQPVEFEDERAGFKFIHSFYPVKDSDGQVTGVVSFSRDVTKQKAAEAELQAAHLQTIEILESITDAFYSLDEHSRFTYVNRKAGFLWGKNPADLLGKVIWEVFPTFKQTEAYPRFMKSLLQKAPDQFETYSKFLDQWVEIHLYPTAHGLSVYFQDITERKKMEEDLRKLKGTAQ